MKYLFLVFLLFISQDYTLANANDKLVKSFTFNDDSCNKKIELFRENDKIYFVRLTAYCDGKIITTSILPLPFPIKNIFIADVNNDGKIELGVALTKKARLHRVNALRPFFYKICDNRLAPLWLGTKLGGELIDFKPVVSGDSTYIKTIERAPKNKYNVIVFKWNIFGFKFVSYLARNASEEQAFAGFNNESIITLQ